MNKDLQEILQALEKFERTPECRGLEHRLEFAELVIQHLKQKDWSQRDLALKASMKESFISRIVHSDANLTVETIGRIESALDFHLDFKVRSAERHAEGSTDLHLVTADGGRTRIPQQETSDHGQEFTRTKEASTGEDRLTFSTISKTIAPFQTCAVEG